MPSYDAHGRMEDCFSGDVERRCYNCPAKSECCFGKDFDPSSEDSCQSCIHADDCKEECDYTPAYSSPVRRTVVRPTVGYTRTPTVVRKVVAKSIHPSAAEQVFRASDDAILIGGGEGSISGGEAASRLGKEALWGALRGTFYMIWEFFRTHKWS